jgi:hypothetical protein
MGNNRLTPLSCIDKDSEEGFGGNHRLYFPVPPCDLTTCAKGYTDNVRAIACLFTCSTIEQLKPNKGRKRTDDR